MGLLGCFARLITGETSEQRPAQETLPYKGANRFDWQPERRDACRGWWAALKKPTKTKPPTITRWQWLLEQPQVRMSSPI